MKIDDWKLATGLVPGDWTHQREVDGIVSAFWPGKLDGRDGWWWALVNSRDLVLAGGWAAGTVRDRNIDMARALVRITPARAAS